MCQVVEILSFSECSLLGMSSRVVLTLLENVSIKLNCLFGKDRIALTCVEMQNLVCLSV